MGTDIHGVFQRKDSVSGQWIDVESLYEQTRHYQLFAVLAGVRNGRGFAGCLTGHAVTPIAEPRGLPAGFVVDEDECYTIASVEYLDPRRRKWRGDGGPLEVWMGDHSHSWLAGWEILAWASNAPVVTKCGIITKAQYEKWDHESSPDSWSGGILGRDVIQVDDTDAAKAASPNWTHIRVQWQRALSEELAYFFDEVRRLQEEHGEVRFVFGFDS